MASAAAKDSAASLIAAVPTSSQGATAMPSRVYKISSMDELEQHLAGSTRKTLLIEFFAEWCGPCKLIASKLEEWAQMYKVTIIKVGNKVEIDVDELEDVAIEYNVGGIPTFVLIKDKQKVEQLEGSQEDRILEAMEKHCEKNPEYGKKVNLPSRVLTSQDGNVNRTLTITEDATNEPNTELSPKRGG